MTENSLSNAERADLLLEVIEVFLNQILYLRNLYPEQIFKKRRIYNAPVYVSIFPALNSYLHNVLRAARKLLKQGELKCVTLRFYHEENTLNEEYKFDVQHTQSTTVDSIEKLDVQSQLFNDDEFLIEFEEGIRSSLYNLGERLKPIEKLPKDAKFKIFLSTTQTAFIRLSHDAHYQDCPWLLDETSRKRSNERKPSILPLTRSDAVGLKLNLEIF